MKKNQHKQAEQKTKDNRSPKKKEPLWLCGCLALFIIIGAGAYFYYQPPSTLSAKTTPARIVRGEQVFSENCLSCHGAKAIGENSAQSRGGQKADGSYLTPTLNGKGHA
jgi:mono/diheme cytochrome c family protein